MEKRNLKLSVVKLTFSDIEGVMGDNVYYLGNRNSVTTFDKAKVFTESEAKKVKINKMDLIEKLFNKDSYYTSGNLMEQFDVKATFSSFTLTNPSPEPMEGFNVLRTIK